MSSKEAEVLWQQSDRYGVQHVFDQMPHHIDAHVVFDKVTADVVWDEDVHSMHDHDGLLQQLALGRDKFVSEVEDMVSAKQKQVHIQVSVGKDDKSIHNIDSQDSLLQQLAQGVIEDRHHKDILWDDELEQDQSSHDDLLQLLADGGKYLGEECPEQVVEEVLTHVNGPSFLLEHGMKSVHGVLDKLSHEDIVAAEQKHVPIRAVWDCAVQEQLSELPCVDIIWDEEPLHDLELQDNLLHQVVTLGEFCDGHGSKVIGNPANFNVFRPNKQIASSASAELDVVVFNDMALADMIWDDLHIFYQPMFDEIPLVSVLWDEGYLDEISSHDVLLQGAYDAAQSFSLQESNRVKLQTYKKETHGIFCLNKYGLYKIATSIRRHWDPGIIKLIMHHFKNVEGIDIMIFDAESSFQAVGMDIGAIGQLPKILDESSNVYACVVFAVEEADNLLTNAGSTSVLQESDPMFDDMLEHYRTDGNQDELSKRHLGMDSARQIINQAVKTRSLVGAYMVYVQNKRAIIFIRQWDPGILTGLACIMGTISTLLQSSSDMLMLQLVQHFRQMKQLAHDPLLAFLRDCCALKILHWTAQGVCWLHIGLAWGQASFSGGGNVMTRIWPRRSPDYQAHLSSHSPSKAHNQDYISAAMHNQERSNNSETENSEEHGRVSSSSGYRDHYPPILL